MLPVYICEDIIEQLEGIKSIIRILIDTYNLDMDIVCAVTDPKELLKNLRVNLDNSVYFLDLDLKSELDGFKLAQKIRKYDPRAFIIIITTHSEMSPMAFEYRIEAMDYIIKEEIKTIEKRILSCLQEAYKRHLAENVETNVLTIPIGKRVHKFRAKDIYYISASESSHKITIIEKSSIMNIPYTLSQAHEQMKDIFMRCHKSYIVNMQHVVNINICNSCIKLDNGMECPVSRRYAKQIKEAFIKNNNSK